MNAFDWFSIAVGFGGVVWATVESIRRFEISNRLRESVQRLEKLVEIVEDRGRWLDSLQAERDQLQRRLEIRTEKLREIRSAAWLLTNGIQSLDCTDILSRSFNMLKDIGLQKDEDAGGAR